MEMLAILTMQNQRRGITRVAHLEQVFVLTEPATREELLRGLQSELIEATLPESSAADWAILYFYLEPNITLTPQP